MIGFVPNADEEQELRLLNRRLDEVTVCEESISYEEQVARYTAVVADCCSTLSHRVRAYARRALAHRIFVTSTERAEIQEVAARFEDLQRFGWFSLPDEVLDTYSYCRRLRNASGDDRAVHLLRNIRAELQSADVDAAINPDLVLAVERLWHELVGDGES